MKSDPNSEDCYLERCRQMVEERLGWGSSNTWSHNDFVEASERISADSGINLSVTTIKRIWGKVKYNGTPASSTLNALAIYLGFENWRSFKISQQFEGEASFEKEGLPEESNQSSLEEVRNPVKETRKRSSLFVSFFFATILLASLFFFQSSRKKGMGSIPEGRIIFNSEPVTTGLPNTVIFNYDISGFDFDSAFIQQNWDTRRRQRIEKENKQITSVYYFPGHFNAKLIVDNVVVKEHGLLIPSEGWLGLVEREGSVAPSYIMSEELKGDGTLFVKPEVLEEKKIDTGKDFRVSYTNAREFGVDGDHFTFEAAVRNNFEDGGDICQESTILIDCENGIFWIPLSSLGCVGNLRLQVGEVFVSGKTTDLSDFGTDLSGWNYISCLVKDQQFELLLNDKIIYSVTYKEPVGKVMGISFRFQGTGAVDYVRLKDEKEKVVYEDEFL